MLDFFQETRRPGCAYPRCMTIDPPWEPPLAGTEVEALMGALDRLRATFRWKVDGLDSAALGNKAIATSALTLGGRTGEDPDRSWTPPF